MALVAGLLASAITAATDAGTIEPHILAGFLVVSGIGLRLEVAISQPRE